MREDLTSFDRDSEEYQKIFSEVRAIVQRENPSLLQREGITEMLMNCADELYAICHLS